jgi:hypothetical protein
MERRIPRHALAVKFRGDFGDTVKVSVVVRGGVCPEAISCFEADRDCFVAHYALRSDGVADSLALDLETFEVVPTSGWSEASKVFLAYCRGRNRNDRRTSSYSACISR